MCVYVYQHMHARCVSGVTTDLLQQRSDSRTDRLKNGKTKIICIQLTNITKKGQDKNNMYPTDKHY